MTGGKGEAIAIMKMRVVSDTGKARRLRRAAASLDGILRVDINYILDSVTVKYDANKLTSAQVKKKLGQNYSIPGTQQADSGKDSRVD